MSYKRITVPVGTILAWSGGYFTGSGNSGFTNALGNTAAAVNSLLNNSGYYVCDGSALNLSTSPIFNGAGRHLPNLTDNRFLQGSTSAGTIGGQNSVTLTIPNLPSHNHTINHNHGTHIHSIAHDHPSFSSGAAGGHFHTYGQNQRVQVGTDNGTAYDAQPDNDFQTNSVADHTHTIDVPNFTGDSQPSSNISFSGNSGDTGSATAYENRPIYLNCFYVIRVG
jgi:hypothetical protein